MREVHCQTNMSQHTEVKEPSPSGLPSQIARGLYDIRARTWCRVDSLCIVAGLKLRMPMFTRSHPRLERRHKLSGRRLPHWGTSVGHRSREHSLWVRNHSRARREIQCSRSTFPGRRGSTRIQKRRRDLAVPRGLHGRSTEQGGFERLHGGLSFDIRDRGRLNRSISECTWRRRVGSWPKCPTGVDPAGTGESDLVTHARRARCCAGRFRGFKNGLTGNSTLL